MLSMLKQTFLLSRYLPDRPHQRYAEPRGLYGLPSARTAFFVPEVVYLEGHQQATSNHLNSFEKHVILTIISSTTIAEISYPSYLSANPTLALGLGLLIAGGFSFALFRPENLISMIKLGDELIKCFVLSMLSLILVPLTLSEHFPKDFDMAVFLFATLTSCLALPVLSAMEMFSIKTLGNYLINNRTIFPEPEQDVPNQMFMVP